MNHRRQFLSHAAAWTVMGPVLNLQWRTYLFVNLSENALPIHARTHLINLLREETTTDHWLPHNLELKIYFSKNKNHEPLAKNIAANLNRLGIPTDIEAFCEQQFQTSWKNLDGAILMDWITPPSDIRLFTMPVT